MIGGGAPAGLWQEHTCRVNFLASHRSGMANLKLYHPGGTSSQMARGIRSSCTNSGGALPRRVTQHCQPKEGQVT